MSADVRIQGSIGVFDSGFGGLNTLRNIVARLPAYDYIYLADSARTPYGPRSPQEITAFSTQALEFLLVHGCELVIFACNTASSDALHAIQTRYIPDMHPDKKVLGVLIPLAEAAVAQTSNGRIGILATEGTVRSNAFVREITKLDASIEIFQQAAPALVPLIEAGEYRSDQYRSGHIEDLLREYLRPLIKEGIDTLILGCTHFDILREVIIRLIGPGISVISEGPVVAEKLEEYLHRHQEIEGGLSTGASRTFYTTGTTERFDALGSDFFGETIQSQTAILEK
jgi:glutamate racemase